MAWTTSLRSEIVDEFAPFVPTQWGLLLNGWMFKPTRFWGDDTGEYENWRRPSLSYRWQSYKRKTELLREDSRFKMKCHRSSNRRRAVTKRRHCAQCLVEMDHSKAQNVRKFCSDHCYKKYWNPEEVLKRMKM